MTYTIEIYLYENQLIFTGIRDLYFEKYKGVGPGIYSQPILYLPNSCSASEIQQAFVQCVKVLEQNEKRIFEEIQRILLCKWRTFCFTTSKSLVLKLLEARLSNHPS